LLGEWRTEIFDKISASDDFRHQALNIIAYNLKAVYFYQKMVAADVQRQDS